MIGETVTSDGIEFVVVWAGGEGLIADRETINLDWTAPKRLYNKTGKHSKVKNGHGADKPEPTLEDVLDD